MGKKELTMEKRRQRRADVFFRVLIVLFTLLILRLAHVQIQQGERVFHVTEHSLNELVAFVSRRGDIVDRDHHRLATNQVAYQIVYSDVKDQGQDTETIIERLAPVLGIAKSILRQRMISSSGLRLLSPHASERVIAFVLENASTLPGVHVLVTPIREYPYGALADHVLGYIGAMPKSMVKTYLQRKYQPNSLVGLDGLEVQYEKWLHEGDELDITLDCNLQAVMQKALQTQIQSLQHQGYSWVTSGVAVAMDPYTGDVLALGSYPCFEPAWFVGGISQHHFRHYVQAANNLAISGLYMPGSTEKPLTLLYALAKGVITRQTEVDDPGYLMVGNTRLHEWKLDGFGKVSLPYALAVSSDVYLYQVGLWLGHYPPLRGTINAWMKKDRVDAFRGLQDYAKQFGLTTITGIDLPGEAQGYFHDHGLLSDLAYMAIGQDQAYTAIGLCQYAAAIGNGGFRLQPTLLHAILAPNGRVLVRHRPRILNHIPILNADLAAVRQGMLWVTTKREGTAWSTFLGDKYAVAGKTGTAQTGVNGRDIASFIGFAPFDHPKIAVAVIIPGAGEGYLSSGPVARKIIDAYLNEVQNPKRSTPIPIHFHD